MSEDLQTVTITVIANGAPLQIKVASTVAQLLAQLNIVPNRVVVQLDNNIIWRNELDQAILHEGSKLEIVTMVGGG
jgi:thiamine biosynthesis protein ThiS